MRSNYLVLFSLLLISTGVRAATGQRDPDLDGLLVELVRTTSVNGQDTEDRVTRLVADFARARECEVALHEAAPARPALVVSSGRLGDEAALAIVAHTDTVAAGPIEEWTHPPFAGVVEGDILYGRGAADCKGGLVAGLGALLRARGEVGRAPLVLVCVPDEENGADGKLGILPLHREGLLRARGAIYAYSGADRILLGHRGVWRFTVTVRGPTFHTGSRRWQDDGPGGNALTALSLLAVELERAGKRYVKGGRGHFENLRTVITPTRLEAGVSFGQVPAAGSLEVDVRLIPTANFDTVMDAVTRALTKMRHAHPTLELTVTPNASIPATEIEPTAAVAQALARSTGDLVPFGVSGPANESYLLNQLGIPTVVFGPRGAGAHAANEFVDLNSVHETSRIYLQTWRHMSETDD